MDGIATQCGMTAQAMIGPFSPLDLSPLVWLDISDPGTVFDSDFGGVEVSDQDPIGLITDKSGNGNDAAQSVSANRPIYHASHTLAGGPAMDRNAGSYSYVTVPQIAAREIVIVTAHSETVFSSYQVLLGGPGSNDQYRLMSNNFGSEWWDGSRTLTTDGVGKNGGANSLTALPMPLAALHLTVGAVVGNQSYNIGSSKTHNRKWRGPICEVLFFPSALSSTDRTNLVNYLVLKWAITV